MPLHQTISIHAPRVGSDGDNSDYIPYHLHFNPRSPCGERLQKMRAIQYIKNFNPRSPCGERRRLLRDQRDSFRISIHAPRVGSDPQVGVMQSTDRIFQSTLPVWGATYKLRLPWAPQQFQSTLPVWGATVGDALKAKIDRHFNPRSPCGERLCRRRDIWRHRHFNPRSPCGERRPHAHTPGSVARNFNPRSPCGERQIIELLETKIILISIHAPRVGSDVINHRHQTSKI